MRISTATASVFTIEAKCLVGCSSHEKDEWYIKQTLPLGITLRNAKRVLEDTRLEAPKGVYRLRKVITHTEVDTEVWD